MNGQHLGWALLVIGALLFYIAWLGTVITAYLFTVHTSEGIFRL